MVLRGYFPAMDAGFVEKTNGGKYLRLLPNDVEYVGEDLQVR